MALASAAAATHLLPPITSTTTQFNSTRFLSKPKLFTFAGTQHSDPSPLEFSFCRNPTLAPRLASPNRNSNVSDDGEDGVLLATLKLPRNIDLDRFELLLFQWANSLCQGATLPLPMPLKVDRVEGGARLGFVEIGDRVDTPVYIDCLIFPPEGSDSGPVFRAIRNGPSKEKVPPGEPRIMRSLLQALQKSAEIARI